MTGATILRSLADEPRASALSHELAARMNAASERDNSLELRDALEAGQTIHYGRYFIHGVLGRGSFATVYDGEHVGLGRRVAIKVPRLRSDNMPSLHERFVREARTSVLVQHPNVLGIYDCGSLQDGTPFLVLERVNGDSLTTIIARGPVSFALVIELGRQLARALSALGDVGIVHRDIKPDNVMLHRSKYGIMLVKLVDFGVAKRSKWQAPMSLTLKGELVGTPQYMAAEQLRGEEVDGRTDIYAVAAVLYEALTGRPPHESTNFSDYLVAALSSPVRPIRELRPDCPAPLERIILRALERDRTLRHDTPEQLLEELNVCKVQLKLDCMNTRAAAHAMAAELEDPARDSAYDMDGVHLNLTTAVISRARGLLRRVPQYELTDSWQQRFDVARDRAVDLARRGGDFTRRAAPSLPRLSLLLCLLLFTRSESLAWPGSDALRAGRSPAQGERAPAPLPTNFRTGTGPSGTPASALAEAAPTTPDEGKEPLVRGIEPPARFAQATNRTAGRAPTGARPAGTRAEEPSAAAPAASKPSQAPASKAGAAAGSASAAATLATHAAAPALPAPTRSDVKPAGPGGSSPRSPAEPRAQGSSPKRTSAAGPPLDEYSDRHETAPSPAAQLAQAMSAFVAGRLDEAKSLYQQVLRHEPNNPGALRGVGLTASRLGDKPLARDSLRRYLAVSPSAPDRAAIEARLAALAP